MLASCRSRQPDQSEAGRCRWARSALLLPARSTPTDGGALDAARHELEKMGLDVYPSTVRG